MLNVTVEKDEGSVPVMIMRLSGELDASNYEPLIVQTQALYAGGMRNLLLDLENLSFISSSGLVCLHNMALIMRGESLADAEEGWRAFHAITRDLEKASAPEAHFKLLKPQPLVQKVLDTSGFTKVMIVYDDEATAVSAFK
ncbi:MAG: STAS domain-containing protein [Anaerolineales bacterium]|nr:STAS domain-containing protein [Anaerolineales bacterium]